MNPFEEKSKPIESAFTSWSKIYPTSYSKWDTDPYTKTRIILMNGTEFEANWFSHRFSRHCTNMDLKRELALIRRVEKQQQMTISCLKPIDETLLESTIGYEQLAVDLTAILAQNEKDKNVKNALDFALLEDFDHLYRYADLLEADSGIHAERLVGKYTEIMPARPTISEHRHPYDNVKPKTDFKTASLSTKLNVSIITAAEQQTMNYYMNIAPFYVNDIGRRLYQEIGLVEEQHVSLYESLIDSDCTFMENALMHEYCECYLYYSCYMDENDENIKKIWEEFFEQELSHLQKTAQLLETFEHKSWQQVIPDGTFPPLLSFHDNIEYVRGVIANTAQNTSLLDDYVNVDKMPDDARFFKFQSVINEDISKNPSHEFIEKYIKTHGHDYRYQTSPHPLEQMRNNTVDNVDLGRVKSAVPICSE